MPDETVADDEALYDIYRRVPVIEVDRIFLALFILAHMFAESRGIVTPNMIARAEALRDGPLALGHLPLVRSVLAGT